MHALILHTEAVPYPNPSFAAHWGAIKVQFVAQVSRRQSHMNPLNMLSLDHKLSPKPLPSHLQPQLANTCGTLHVFQRPANLPGVKQQGSRD